MPITCTPIPEMLTALVKRSVTETIESLCDISTSFADEGRPDAPCDGMCGIVSFVGDLSWSFMLALPRQTALDLTFAFTGFELEFDSADLADAVGEVANILGGDLVARLEEHGTKVAMSLPTVARGRDVHLLLPHDVSRERLSFLSPAGEFGLTVAMVPPVPILMPGQQRGLLRDDAREVAAAGPAWRK
jgi:chemotaxis protein CheX